MAVQGGDDSYPRGMGHLLDKVRTRESEARREYLQRIVWRSDISLEQCPCGDDHTSGERVWTPVMPAA